MQLTTTVNEVCSICGSRMELMNDGRLYCSTCTNCPTTLKRIGVIDLRNYTGSSKTTLAEIRTAVINDLVAHGFVRIVIRPPPNRGPDTRYPIWGRHVDPTVITNIDQLAADDDLYIYWYHEGTIIREGDTVTSAFYNGPSNQSESFAITRTYHHIMRWMELQNTRHICQIRQIYKTAKYYDLERKRRRDGMKLQQERDLNEIRRNILSLKQQLEFEVEVRLTNYNTRHNERPPVDYVTLRLPDIPQ